MKVPGLSLRPVTTTLTYIAGFTERDIRPDTYFDTRPSSAEAFQNHGRSRRRRYPGMVGFLSRMRCAHCRASWLRPCEIRKVA